jgi:ABC-type transport system substrate-binding protein
MKRYMAAGKALARDLGVDQFDLAKSAQIMQDKGWQRGTNKFWQKDGQTFSFVIDIIPHFQDLVQILVEQLKKAGFDVTDNPYINSAYWSRTWLLVLLNLEPVEN